MKEVKAHEVIIKGATKRYGELIALNNFDLNIKPGSFTVLLGPSGSGKSTLIRSIAGIEQLDGGSIHFGEQEIAGPGFHLPPEKRDLAMVFQDYALWPHMSVYENVAYALKRRKLDSHKVNQRVSEMLERVGLGHKAESYPFQLSGGEQQRVALARAIVGRPALLLFDEPLSNLDADLREKLRVEIATLTREIGSTACYITHDQSEAFALADQIGVMRGGLLQQLAAPEIIYGSPSNKFVAEFTGIAGKFEGKVSKVKRERVVVKVAHAEIEAHASTELAEGSKVEVLIRPSATQFKDGEESIPAEVIDVAYRGRGYEHVVQCELGIITNVFNKSSVKRGSKVSITIDHELCHAF